MQAGKDPGTLSLPQIPTLVRFHQTGSSDITGVWCYFLGKVWLKVWSGASSSFRPAQLYPNEGHFRSLGYCHRCSARWIELSLVDLSGYWVCYSTCRCLVVSSTWHWAGGREGIDRSWKSKVLQKVLEGKVGVVMARELLFTGKR